MSYCLSEELRLAYLHEVLQEVVDAREATAVQQHIENCSTCQQWITAARQLDARFSIALQQVTEPLPELQPQIEAVIAATIHEQKRGWWVWSGSLIAAMSLIPLLVVVATGLGIWQVGFSGFLIGASKLLTQAVELINVALLLGQTLLPRLLPYAQAAFWASFIILSPWLVRLAIACDQRALTLQTLEIQKGVSL